MDHRKKLDDINRRLRDLRDEAQSDETLDALSEVEGAMERLEEACEEEWG